MNVRVYVCVEREREDKMVNRMYRGSVEINRGRGGPRRRWRDEVREFLVEERYQ